MAVSSPAFVGRSEQLDALVAALDRAEAGEAAAVFIGGEAGVGKTRLVAEFERIARARGARVLAGGCVDVGGSELPYARLLGPLRMLVRELEPGRLEKLVGAGARSTGAVVGRARSAVSGARRSICWAQTRLFEPAGGLGPATSAWAPCRCAPVTARGGSAHGLRLGQTAQPQDEAETTVRGQAHSGREPRPAVDLREPRPPRQRGVVQPLLRDGLL